jgi:acetyl esterase
MPSGGPRRWSTGRRLRPLADEGTTVELSRYPGMAHGFFTMTGTLPASRAAIEQAAAHLRKCLEAAA